MEIPVFYLICIGNEMDLVLRQEIRQGPLTIFLKNKLVDQLIP